MWITKFHLEILASITFILLSSVVTLQPVPSPSPIVIPVSTCYEQKERMSSFLDGAVDLILKAKSENITCATECKSTLKNPLDCAEIYRNGYYMSGVYDIYPINRLTYNKRIPVYCDMTDGGGWTVIQRRGDFGRAGDYFNQDWKSYREGFGDLQRDFWFGNDNIFAITNQKAYSVRFDLEDKHQNRVYADYARFWIDDEFNNYTLHISGYWGTAGDSMMDYHNTMKFSTKDRDNDSAASRSCAVKYKSGWWFNSCYYANLNGVYHNDTEGIKWMMWKRNESLRRVEIKIRPSFSMAV